MIDVTGLALPDVLVALYDRAIVEMRVYEQIARAGTPPMTREFAAHLLEAGPWFDWLNGRRLRVRLAGGAFDERAYDDVNGLGAAREAMERLRPSEPRLARVHVLPQIGRPR
jgi:hypothetical protein